MARAYANGEPQQRQVPDFERPMESGRGGLKETNMPRVLITLVMLGLFLVGLVTLFFFNLSDFA